MAMLSLKVSEIEAVAELVRSVVLTGDAGTLPPYTAGSHLEVMLPDGATRPYSLIDFDGDCGAPAAYRFGVRLEDPSRGGSRFMHGLEVGQKVEVRHPKNDFRLVEGNAPSVLIAGGIGITPLISMATALRKAGRPYRLHYAVRSEAAAAFAGRLAQQHGDAFTLYHDDVGPRLDLGALIADAPREAQLYVCGPRGMIEAARELAMGAGFPHAQVHFELFQQAAASEAGDAPFEVEVASSGEVFAIPPGQSIIDVLEAGGVDLIYDCRRGDCGICQTEVLEGEPDHRDVVLSDEERASGRVMQICVSRARSPRLKLDL